MRASTVFAIAASLLVGLIIAAGAKYAGVFNKKDAPPPPAPPAPFRVLASMTNLFEDVTVTADQVMVRDIQPREEEELARKYGPQWKEKLMPPMVTAAHHRVARQNIVAGEPLLKDHFSDQHLPDTISDRLDGVGRAVSVSVAKHKSGGGVLRVGEYVDVLLTTKVDRGGQQEFRTAPIARACKVIMKRNNPWAMMAADPDDRPLSFTLQANPYRAALIEFAQTHGELSLFPVPRPAAKPTGTFSDPTSKEYATEDQRVDAVLRGEMTISDADLVRIFNLTPLAAGPPRLPPVQIQHISGVNEVGRTVFPSSTGSGITQPGRSSVPSSDAPPTQSPPTTPSYDGDVPPQATFRLPSATPEPSSGCKACDAAKKKAAEAAGPPPLRAPAN